MKTTITGFISAATSFVLFASQMPAPYHVNIPPIFVLIALFANLGGLAALGITAKDYNATGGTIPKTPEAVQRVDKAE